MAAWFVCHSDIKGRNLMHGVLVNKHCHHHLEQGLAMYKRVSDLQVPKNEEG